jgi:mRNA-degrading endonuclease RelE of RelBE toxin-antitoxin system
MVSLGNGVKALSKVARDPSGRHRTAIEKKIFASRWIAEQCQQSKIRPWLSAVTPAPNRMIKALTSAWREYQKIRASYYRLVYTTKFPTNSR